MSTSPLLTWHPASTCTSKPLPSSFTVSIPTWIIIPIPESVVNPKACFVSKTNKTVPSSGATTTPSSGVTTAPSPIILLAKASSGAVERSAAIPVIGLEMITVLVGSLVSAASCALSETVLESSVFESVAEAAFSFFASSASAVLFSTASSSKCSSVTLAR